MVEELIQESREEKVGEYVCIEYEGELYPGRVEEIVDGGLRVNTMTKCMGLGWKWPATKDELIYPWSDIESVINPSCMIAINKRGVFSVKCDQLFSRWG